MGAYSLPPILGREESLRGKILGSGGLHLLLFVGIAAYSFLGPSHGPRWGADWKDSGAIHVKAVTSLPGLPLPPPSVVTSTVTVPSPALYQVKPLAPPKVSPHATPIPKFKDAIVRRPRRIRENTRIDKHPVAPPSNAIPFEQGGRPQMNYAAIIQSAAGSGGITFSDNNFGAKYGWYVNAVRQRISSNWLTSTISSSIVSAPRVYVDFDILRNGTITNAQIARSSGIAEVDRAALRAVLASSPLGPLPPGYSGDKVSVEFYFELPR